MSQRSIQGTAGLAPTAGGQRSPAQAVPGVGEWIISVRYRNF